VGTYLLQWLPLIAIASAITPYNQQPGWLTDVLQTLKTPMLLCQFWRTLLPSGKQDFHTFDKGIVDKAPFDLKSVWPMFALFYLTVFVLAALTGSMIRLGVDWSCSICLYWTAYTCLVAMCCICAAIEERSPLSACQISADIPAELAFKAVNGRKQIMAGRIISIGEGGARLQLDSNTNVAIEDQLGVLKIGNFELQCYLGCENAHLVEIQFAEAAYNDSEISEKLVNIMVGSNRSWQTVLKYENDARLVDRVLGLLLTPMRVLLRVRHTHLAERRQERSIRSRAGQESRDRLNAAFSPRDRSL